MKSTRLRLGYTWYTTCIRKNSVHDIRMIYLLCKCDNLIRFIFSRFQPDNDFL